MIHVEFNQADIPPGDRCVLCDPVLTQLGVSFSGELTRDRAMNPTPGMGSASAAGVSSTPVSGGPTFQPPRSTQYGPSSTPAMAKSNDVYFVPPSSTTGPGVRL